MRWRAAVLVFVASLGVYLSTGHTVGAGDTLPARYLPWSILRGQWFALDAYPWLYDAAALRTFPVLDGLPYFLRHANGHYVSAYTPAAAVTALPVYALPVLAGAPPSAAWSAALEKLAAAAITALSAVLLFLAVDRLVERRWALAIAAVYAFGTSSFSVSSQGLWQHGPSQLFVSLLLYQLVRARDDDRWLAATGLSMACASIARATDAALFLPLAVWIAATRPSLIPRFVAFAASPGLALALYNWTVLGSLSGRAGSTNAPTAALFSQTPLLEGLSGVLLSPGRGLFVYSPVLALGVIGCAAVWRGGPPAFRALSAGLPLVALVVGKWFLWWGGHSWGPRLLADTAPVLCFFLYPLVKSPGPRPVTRALIAATAVWSIGAHALGAFAYDGRWDGLPGPAGPTARLWSWRDGPLPFYAREVATAAAAAFGPRASHSLTSASAPEQLAASLTATAVPAAVLVGESIPVTVTATNTGQATWLPASPEDRGTVKLGWRWLRGGEELPGGREGLGSEVAPGASAVFPARIPVPAEPGDYQLVLDLVSERLTWFATRGSRPIAFPVSVRPLSVERFVASPLSPPPPPSPGLAIATDRRAYRQSDRQQLAVTVTYPHDPRPFDAYLVLEGPRGSGFLFDGRRLAPASEQPWRVWVKELPLPARADSRLTLPLSDLAPGVYRWNVVLAMPGTLRPVAVASADFSVEP